MEKLKEHEALGMLDDVFAQLEPAARERALAWLRAKYPEKATTAPTLTAPLQPLGPVPAAPWPPPGIIEQPPHPPLDITWEQPVRTTCGGGIPLGHGGAFTVQSFEGMGSN